MPYPQRDNRRLLPRWATLGVAAVLGAVAWEVLRRRLIPPTQDDLRQLYFPSADGTWDTVDPASVGWDPDALAAALDLAGRRLSTGVVMLQGGRILAERYWDGATAESAQDVFSAQKSFTSVLIGIAQQEGRLNIDDSITRWVGAKWSRAEPEEESQVLIRHLLTMTSGLDSQLRYQEPAGNSWYYNTQAYHVLQPVLEKATGSTLQSYSEHVLFGPLGMTSAAWMSESDRARTDSARGDRVSLEITPRDMARFGLLVLAGGWWAGTSIIDDPAYLRASLSPSQDYNPSYGLLWWLNGEPSHELPGDDPQPVEGPIIPSAPFDLVAALGTNDQKIYVVPSLDLVITRQGGPAGPSDLTVSSFDSVWWRALMEAAPK
jgi:CubicO group peptidase (beta-lactamase class C family)